MGVMEQNLRYILSKQLYRVEDRQIQFPSYSDIEKSKYKEEVIRIYKLLGGINDNFPLNLRKWDMEVDGIAVELDEYLHFNRYRALTLKSNIISASTREPSSGIFGAPLAKITKLSTFSSKFLYKTPTIPLILMSFV